MIKYFGVIQDILNDAFLVIGIIQDAPNNQVFVIGIIQDASFFEQNILNYSAFFYFR